MEYLTETINYIQILGEILADGSRCSWIISNDPYFVIRNTVGEEFQDTPLDAVFGEDDSEVLEDDSDSDGFLSEV